MQAWRRADVPTCGRVYGYAAFTRADMWACRPEGSRLEGSRLEGSRLGGLELWMLALSNASRHAGLPTCGRVWMRIDLAMLFVHHQETYPLGESHLRILCGVLG